MGDPYGLTGSVLSQKYRVDRLIGEGGYGVVYAATHLTLGQPVAVKCLKTRDASAAQGFMREAQILFQLSHPAIVRLFDAGTLEHASFGSVPWVVLELVAGTTLDREIALRATTRRPFSAAEIARIFDPLLDGAAYAHERGIVHRDLKPANVMLAAGDPASRILDFGTARAVGHISLGQTGASPAYAAPEQWDPAMGAMGPPTDVFALGLTLAEMCLLTAPLGGGGLPSLLAAAMDPSRRPSIANARPDLPPGIAAVVDRALRVRPEERFANAREMELAFRAAVANVPMLTPGHGPAVTPPPPAHGSAAYGPAAISAPIAPSQPASPFSPTLIALLLLAVGFVGCAVVFFLYETKDASGFSSLGQMFGSIPVPGSDINDDQPKLGLVSDPNAPPPTAPPPASPPPAHGPYAALEPVSGADPYYAAGDILGVERPHHHEIDQCIADAERVHAFEGNLGLIVSGTKDGAVTDVMCSVVNGDVNLETQAKDPGAIAACSCAQGAVGAWHFPKTRGRVGLLTEFSFILSYVIVGDREKKP